MKLIIISVLLILTVVNSTILGLQTYIFGSTKDFKPYELQENGIYVDVSFPQLRLTKVPQVFTSLSCDTNCWSVLGTNSVYDVRKDSFRVYLRYPTGGILTVDDAKKYKYKLNYVIYPQK